MEGGEDLTTACTEAVLSNQYDRIQEAKKEADAKALAVAAKGPAVECNLCHKPKGESGPPQQQAGGDLQQPQEGEPQKTLEGSQGEHPPALNQLKGYFTGQLYPMFSVRTRRCGGDGGSSGGSRGSNGGDGRGAAHYCVISGVGGLQDERAMELNFGDIIAMPMSTAKQALVKNLHPEPKNRTKV